MDGWYRITTRTACAALLVDEGRIVTVAPIFWRWKGALFSAFCHHFRRSRIERLP